MDPTGIAIAIAIIFGGNAALLLFRERSWPGRVGGVAVLGVLAPLTFWALTSAWMWAIVAAAVVGWVVWCAARLVGALLT